MPTINQFNPSGRDVAELVDRIEKAVDGENNIVVSTACIVVSALAQDPDVSPDKLVKIVEEVSSLIAMILFDGSPTGAVN